MQEQAGPSATSTLYPLYLRHRRISIDSRRVEPGDLFFALKGERTDGNRYAAAALEAGAAYAIVDDDSVVEAARADRYHVVDDSLSALQRLATTHRHHLQLPVLAITGSNGKTTTKELITAVLSRQYRIHATPGNYNNHLGLPLTILAAPPDMEMMILEMGANHQREIAALCEIGRPTHGLVTNVGDAHLEGFGGREGVIKGKGELYDFLAANGGVGFVNQDEQHLGHMARNVGRIISFLDNETPAPEIPGMEIKPLRLHPTVAVAFLCERRSLRRAATQLSGRHNLQNIKAAVAIGKYFKVPGESIVEALESYQPTNHRSQWIEQQGVRFYWDAYNANPSSVAAALEAYAAAADANPHTDVVILGEMLELGRDSPAAHRRAVLRAGRVARTVLLVGGELAGVATEFERPHFNDVGALKDWFWRQDWSGRRVFVKGSRGNRLEKLLD